MNSKNLFVYFLIVTKQVVIIFLAFFYLLAIAAVLEPRGVVTSGVTTAITISPIIVLIIYWLDCAIERNKNIA